MKKWHGQIIFVSLMILLIAAVILYMKEDTLLSHPQAETSELVFSCVPPGYGEFSSNLIFLDKTVITLKPGKTVTLIGVLTGKAFHVGNETCYYDGNVTLRAYLGPKTSKSAWSYIGEKLTKVEGLDVKIDPQKLCLKPNERAEFKIEITPQKAGTYYLYIVAVGENGWKSWDVIEVEVS
ncbi:hypothetical protein [Thermococcus thioreducens]|uniref:Uncharacterized protein n=1 Tax=Thermococcus thioreducens TaxID=277988 RepID=A0A0Q2M082_9EURY|nr:hypothetical protein [Thermococcus thioreducens]ASJ12988.1 hypothetical protein A3L14_08855 [Thermococcus thioreducens]KQH81465.1 hypothetical protein AMR53_11255 [Thermococcus thioreducens]SEV82583.1 hypothetical protein SAMN05216170_0168 [Thermococcus thioreducens]